MCISKTIIRAALVAFLPVCLLPAQVIINEVVTSNSVHEDEEGSTPDWIELLNTDTLSVDISGYHLSDKPDRPTRWRIDNLVLAPGQYAFVWASAKDRNSLLTYRTLIDRGDNWRYLVPSGPVEDNWKSVGFDATEWAQGPSGIGYGDGDDATEIPWGTLAVFMRKTFTVDDPSRIDQLLFDIDYDDGFVAYLNGVEITRENMNGANPAWNASSITFTEPRIVFEGAPTRWVIDNPQELLVAGENVLAIQGHNAHDASSDLTFIPFLTARYTGVSEEGSNPPAILELSSGTGLHTNFRLSSGGETVYLNDPQGQLVDSLPAYDLPPDVSIGVPLEGGPLQYFASPTPGEPNPASGFTGAVTDQLAFDHPGGPTEALTVTINGASAASTIRYTLDATEPTVSSPAYNGPVSINRTTVLRAAAFQEDKLPSTIITATYLVGVDHDLPVVTLTTEPDNLFHPVTGMYVLGEGYQGDFPFFGSNIWEDTEHPVHLGFYEPDGSDALSFDGGLKIFGNYSRANDQRSFSLFARGRYGDDDIDYPFFPQREYDKFQSIVLRNSGNDNGRTMLRDVILTSLMQNSNVDVQAYRSVASYVNGEYWGMYNMREKINEDFLASLHDVDADSVDILEREGQVIEGSADDYLALIDYVNRNDLRLDEHYRYVKDRIDLDNYVQYFAAQIYYDNRDWPGNNIKFWRPHGGKWRWILFDTDFGAGIWDVNAAEFNTLNFSLEPNGPNWPNPPWSTLLFRKLMDNVSFRHHFINQLADEMNSRFLSVNTTAHITRLALEVENEIWRHGNRWWIADWVNQVERVKDFFRRRPANMKRFVRDRYNLPAVRRLRIRISDTEQGYVTVNSLTVDRISWGGDYFQNVPVRVTAVPREGYRFVRWELDATSTEASLELNLTGDRTLRPVFEETTTTNRPPLNTLAGVVDLVLSPNPSASAPRLSFRAGRSVELTASLLSMDGKPLRQLFQRSFGAGTQVQRLTVDGLPAGTYLIRLRDAEGGRVTLRWVKQ